MKIPLLLIAAFTVLGKPGVKPSAGNRPESGKAGESRIKDQGNRRQKKGLAIKQPKSGFRQTNNLNIAAKSIPDRLVGFPHILLHIAVVGKRSR